MSVNEKMTAIADAIRDKTGGTEALTLDGMATEISKVYEEGKKAEYDAFWNNYQSKTQYLYAFSFNWNDEIYKPIKEIVLIGSNCCNGMYYYSKITDTKVKISFKLAGNGTSSTAGFMNNATEMKTIREIVFGEKTAFANTSFQNCGKLEEMNVSGTIGQNGFNLQWSTNLNKASIESIINCLSATTSGLTVTLSEVAVNNAFTAEEWQALTDTKKNWTISLV